MAINVAYLEFMARETWVHVPFLNLLFSVKISLLCILRKLFLPPIHVLVFSEKEECFERYHNFVQKHVERKISAVNGSSAELLSGYLDEYLWRERYEKNGLTGGS